ncbi:hypothetical protein ACP70R_044030 [Stipagrostis hirtigluma subsp. patula]
MKMLQDVYPVLLLFVVFLNLATTISSNHIISNMGAPSLNNSSSFADTDETTMGTLSDGSKVAQYHAVYIASSPPKSGYTGGMATLDILSFPDMKNNGEVTGALLWVSNEQHADRSDTNSVQAGWVVDPSHYGDSKTHFFVYWTLSGFDESTGCFNLDCEGFVPVNDAPITPGDTLEPATGQAKISFKIFKSKDDGDWWLHFGYDINNLKPVGFWPKRLFTSLEDHAKRVSWGGYASCYHGTPSPPMGNGQWPGKYSASFQNVQLVDSNGQGYDTPAWSLRVYSTNTKCYQASPFFDSMFYYGGPGGCTN